MYFFSDQPGPTGRRFRCFNIVDNFTRECLAIEVDTSLTGLRVAEVLEGIIFIYGVKPRTIIIDNGPEFTGRDLDQFRRRNGIRLDFIRPSKSVENVFVESFNGKFRDECLNANWFAALVEAKVESKNGEKTMTAKDHIARSGVLSPNECVARFAA